VEDHPGREQQLVYLVMLAKYQTHTIRNVSPAQHQHQLRQLHQRLQGLQPLAQELLPLHQARFNLQE